MSNEYMKRGGSRHVCLDILPGEHWFHLTARNKHAVAMMRYYSRLLAEDGDAQGAQEMERFAGMVAKWQENHASLVGAPAPPHVTRP